MKDAGLVVKGIGGFIPKNKVTNSDLAKKVDTSDEWISSRTGMKVRYIAEDGQKTSDLAYEAAIAALKDANMKASELDLIILATTTPDNTFPATAVKVQNRLGANNAFAFDIQAVCTGFVYGLSTAKSFFTSGQAKNILVIGAETLSKILDWKDRTTCVLFGDGAGAVVLGAGQEGHGIIDSKLYSDGSLYDFLKTTGGVSETGEAGFITMEGKEIFRHAVEKMTASIEHIIDKNSLKSEDIDLVVPHQANKRIIDAIATKLKFDQEKVLSVVDKFANTSAASIPLALAYAHKNKQIKGGQNVILTAFGGGLTWGSILLKW